MTSTSPRYGARGNGQAAYVDDLNTNWTAGGASRANDVMASAKKLFSCGVPKWFIVNEVSAGLWPGNATYRDFVVEFAKTLSGTHGRTVVVTAPFDKPGKNGAWWSALAKHAFVGAQVYLSGKEVNAQGNSVSWCQSQYQASIDAYANRGVAKNRLFIFEHFGNTLPNVGWGRAGVSSSGWHNAIKARAQALKNLKLTGFVSYGWGGNDMHAPPGRSARVHANVSAAATALDEPLRLCRPVVRMRALLTAAHTSSGGASVSGVGASAVPMARERTQFGPMLQLTCPKCTWLPSPPRASLQTSP